MTIASTDIEHLTKQFFQYDIQFSKTQFSAILAKIVWSYFQLKCFRIASFTNEQQD